MTRTLEILDRLIAFDTVSRNSNLELAGYAADILERHGFAVTRIPSADGGKTGLYAEIGPTGDGIMLSAHTDVVPVDGQDWTRDPFRLTREGDRLFGRGTTDMKGYLASILSLAERAARADLREPLKMVLSYDEEIGCVGIQEMLDRVAPLIGQPRACFVGEPTEMQVAVGHKGKAALRATCFGQSGHSALAPNFVNALHLATDFVTELRGLQRRFAEQGHRDPAYSVPYTTLHVGLLTGGTALNIVPDRAEITFEYRHLAADPAADILRAIHAAAERVSETYRRDWNGARIEIEQYNAYPGLDVPDSDCVIGLAQKLARTNDTTKVAFGTEAGFFSELGIPTVVCGPGSMEGQGHKPDEYLTLSQLRACDEMMDRILEDLSH
ncbi:acetylornithine deacetylase [Alisedimentitalea sp. MJ-SS2]|uniref:acetylornithine deacetylase n=1 Tax=Aliisedimentitalea sp. MJ-SS2 TaxID=3049795 RepID=UPI00290E864F|nr:acetylornithine deacetylase [Alisedimentitalea sp. MJ-SS2]MDU8929909.1 acetylornithine deacetylase [Alisedimentitalea sp. MJ-SS2]